MKLFKKKKQLDHKHSSTTQEPVKKRVEDKKKQKKKKAKLTYLQRKRNLESYLSKAGYYDITPEQLRTRTKKTVFVLAGLAWLVLAIIALLAQNYVVLGIYTLVIWTVGLATIWMLTWGVIYFYLEMRIYNRRKELEDVLPDFLQLTSANISAGMPIDRALWLAIRPSFGVLAKEIEDVAKATISGEDLQTSLQKLVHRYDSVLLKRSVSIILEGLESGGELADLLNKISLNIQEIKIMKKEMAANVTTYAIFISFASVAVAPILFALATQLIEVIISITGNMDLSSSTLALGGEISPDLTQNFLIYSYLMLAITAGMSAAIISAIRYGNVRDGIRNIPIYIVISFAIFSVANFVLGNMLGAFF